MNNESLPGSNDAFEKLRKQQDEISREVHAAVARLKTEGINAKVVDETPETVTVEFVGPGGEVRRSGFMKTGDVCEQIKENIRNPHDPDPNASRRPRLESEEE